MDTEHNIPDPTGKLTELHDAIRNPALDQVAPDGTATPEASDAAMAVARCYGYCTLYGLDAGDDAGTLPASIAIAAARAWITNLTGWIDGARTLYQQWLAEDDADECEDLVARYVMARTDMEAIAVALEDARIVLSEDGDPLAETVTQLTQTGTALIDQFDAALERHVDVLATLVGTPYWHNWRAALADENREPFPWWLGEPVITAATRLYGKVVVPSELATQSRATIAPEFAPPQLAAAGQTGAAFGATWVFHDPSGRYVAKLDLPANLSFEAKHQPLLLQFVQQDGVPAVELHGMPATFGPVNGQIRHGNDFTEFVTATAEPLTFAAMPTGELVRLFVDGIEWQGESQA